MNDVRVIIDAVKQFAKDSNDDQQLLTKVVQYLHEVRKKWNWVGIYLLSGDTLVLGPYVGKPTDHTRIEVGVGVCGTAVAADQNIIVGDVRKLTNYLACSIETLSEIVVLIRNQGTVVGQFDIDSDEVNAFEAGDEQLLEQLGEIIAPQCARLIMRTSCT